MNINRNKLLHLILITLIIFAPVRSVMATQQSHCDMDSDEMTEMVSSSAHMSHDMSAIASSGSMDQNSEMNHDCCCCDNGCTGNCDMSIGASLIMQSSSYGPVFKTNSESITTSTDILVRALTPPSRPPAFLYN